MHAAAHTCASAAWWLPKGFCQQAGSRALVHNEMTEGETECHKLVQQRLTICITDVLPCKYASPQSSYACQAPRHLGTNRMVTDRVLACQPGLQVVLAVLWACFVGGCCSALARLWYGSAGQRWSLKNQVCAAVVWEWRMWWHPVAVALMGSTLARRGWWCCLSVAMLLPHCWMAAMLVAATRTLADSAACVVHTICTRCRCPVCWPPGLLGQATQAPCRGVGRLVLRLSCAALLLARIGCHTVMSCGFVPSRLLLVDRRIM